jgi:uncharacterized phage protein (TIGR01671 family)
VRENKFRAWNKVNKTMYDSAIYNCKDTFDMILKHPQIYEVMQYTGLKDKDGKEIYEGDIVNDGDLNFEVYRHNSGEWKAGWCSLWEYISDNEIENCWEIIGNIYENPEILENNL